MKENSKHLKAFSILSCRKYMHKVEFLLELEALASPVVQDSLEEVDSQEGQLADKQDHQDQVSTKSIDYQFVYFPNSSLVLTYLYLNK
jgi:hypothetical protein